MNQEVVAQIIFAVIGLVAGPTGIWWLLKEKISKLEANYQKQIAELKQTVAKQEILISQQSSIILKLVQLNTKSISVQRLDKVPRAIAKDLQEIELELERLVEAYVNKDKNSK